MIPTIDGHFPFDSPVVPFDGLDPFSFGTVQGDTPILVPNPGWKHAR